MTTTTQSSSFAPVATPRQRAPDGGRAGGVPRPRPRVHGGLLAGHRALHNAAHDFRHAQNFPATDANAPGMILRLLSAALAAGFLAAVVATGLQLALTSPLILEAEKYEQREPAARRRPFPPPCRSCSAHAGHDHAAPDAARNGSPPPASSAWPSPASRPRRRRGLRLMLGAGADRLRPRADAADRPRLRWPASPASPGPSPSASAGIAGAGAAALLARQAWWVMTAAATAMGLYLSASAARFIAILGGSC